MVKLNVEEVELIRSALNSLRLKLGAIQYDDEWEKRKRLESIRVLASRFEDVLRHGFLNGVANFQVPDQLNVAKTTQVKAFPHVESLNEFLVKNVSNIEVVNIKPWLKHHGYEEYLLTYMQFAVVTDKEKHP